MYKYLIVIGFIFSGCSNFAINGMMCDQIKADPFSTIPPECRSYSESAAKKASKAPEILPPDDLLIFEKDK